MPHVVLCDQPKNLSRFIQFVVAVSPAFDCAVVSHGHIQMTYVPCSVEALICFDHLEYFSHAMRMLKMLATRKTPRTPKLQSTGSSAQSSSPSSPSSRCDCHPLPVQLPVRPSATNRATISQFSADLVRVC